MTRSYQPQATVLIVGLAILLFGFVEGIQWLTTTTTGSPGVPGSVRASDPPPPQEVSLRAVLELPTATATVRPKPTPTAVPTKAPDFCEPGVTAPGGLCQKPIPTPRPPTPFPPCDDPLVEPRDWCVWGSPEGEG